MPLFLAFCLFCFHNCYQILFERSPFHLTGTLPSLAQGVFNPHLDPRGRGGEGRGGRLNGPSPNSWTTDSIEMKFWQWIYMHQRVSQKSVVYIAFVLFTLVPRQAMKTGVSLSRFPYTFLYIQNKTFNSSKLVNFFHLRVAQVLLIPKTCIS